MRRGKKYVAADPADGRRTLPSLTARARRVVDERATGPAERPPPPSGPGPGRNHRAAELLDGPAGRLLP